MFPGIRINWLCVELTRNLAITTGRAAGSLGLGMKFDVKKLESLGRSMVETTRCCEHLS